MKNKKVFLSVILACVITSLIIPLDLLTKHYIIAELIPNVGNSIDVMPGFINFVYVKNTGAAWGMMAGRPIFLIVISIIILGIYFWFYILQVKRFKEKTSNVLGISLGLIAGGCIGNLVDRIVFGYVRDFINFQFMNFPVFNFADISLTFGVILMVVYFLFIFGKENKKEKIKANKDEQININLGNDLNAVNEVKIENQNDIEENSEIIIEEENNENNDNLSENDKKEQKNDENTSNLTKGDKDER